MRPNKSSLNLNNNAELFRSKVDYVFMNSMFSEYLGPFNNVVSVKLKIGLFHIKKYQASAF